MQREYSPEIKARLKELAQQDLYTRRRPKADTYGKRFGKLVIERNVGHGLRGRLIVLCHCDCGGASVITYDALRNGVKSCGCLQAERRPHEAKRRKKVESFERLFDRTFSNRTAKPVAVNVEHTDIDIDEIEHSPIQNE